LAQKSLPILNKVNTSMVWYTTYYHKHYKWLSSQNLYLLYFFNKLFIYLDFFFINLLWLKPYQQHLYYVPAKNFLPTFTKIRFYKPVTSYLINVSEVYIIFNIYYKTTLEAFQNSSKKKKKQYQHTNQLFLKKYQLSHMYYV